MNSIRQRKKNVNLQDVTMFHEILRPEKHDVAHTSSREQQPSDLLSVTIQVTIAYPKLNFKVVMNACLRR